MDKILVVGGTGMIGTFLTTYLDAQGFSIRLLSRKPDSKSPFPMYKWDIQKGYIDPKAFQEVDVIINLAGAGIVDRRWTNHRKQVLRSSRVDGNQLLAKYLATNEHRVRLFIGASAIGIYGNRGKEQLTEASKEGPPGFLVDLCREWEESHQTLSKAGISVVSLRIGLVLANSGGILPTLSSSIILGIGAYFGKGLQYMPWIHVHDLCRLVNYIISHGGAAGIYNAVGPSPVTNKLFIKSLVKIKGGLGWTLPVPAWILWIIMGARAEAILQGANVMPARALEEGFSFRFKNLEEALRDLMDQ